MTNLEYECDLLKEVVEDDCLVVTSKGLGLEKLLVQLLQVYTEPSLLLFILGGSPDLEDYVIRRLVDGELPTNRVPKRINFDVGVSDRQKLYLQGGVFFITSRILVVDLLLDRVPIENVTGIIVWDAHTVLESHQESFILRLFRTQNTEGFIKAFSQEPSMLTRGFGSIERCLRRLFVNRLLLWPRTRKEVSDSLSSRAQPDVIEFRFNLTSLMEAIQMSILELISMTLKDLKDSNKNFFSDSDDLTIENAVTPGFAYMLRKQFEPVWAQISLKSKRIIDDINVLRRLLFALTDEDCVSFLELIDSVMASVKVDSTRISDWVFYDPAQTLFSASKERIMTRSGLKEREDLELNPKWITFCEIIQEIRKEAKNHSTSVEVPILVIVRNESITEKLKTVLDMGPERALSDLYGRSRNAAEKIKTNTEKIEHKKKSKPDDNLDKSTLNMSDIVLQMSEESKSPDEVNIVFHVCRRDGYLRLEEILRKYRLRHIIMFDPDIESIRRLEIYQAFCVSPDRLKLYFFIFDGSAEEQRYLTSIRKEKDAFSALTQEQDNLISRSERDGKSGTHPDLERSSTLALVNSRKRSKIGRQALNQTVIVDTREFRSELPSLLHKRGIDVVPVTIDIGDYILTPDMCVERKAINDLISSLSSGRLYTQVSYMIRHYKKSVLLIEFEEKHDFGLRGKISFDFRQFRSSGLDSLDTVRKLCLLTITFPQLRLIWSPSPEYSADIFEYLKVDKEQPDVKKVLDASSEQLPTDQLSDKFELEGREFLLSLPGVTFHNVYGIMRKYSNVVDLMSASKDELSILLESEGKGQNLFNGLHSMIGTTCVNEEIVVKNALNDQKPKRKK